MSPRLRDQRGGVMVLAAVMIPVFLLFTATIVDVGNWYTHKRQLQNRADAAALSAGIAYAQNWKACVYDGADPAKLALKQQAAQRIANAALQYAADPEAADYKRLDPAAAVPATMYNDQIARQDPNQAQNFLDVVLNSRDNDYTDDTDYTDDYDSDNSSADPTPGSPCYRHLTDGSDNLSVVPGHWTDVKVTERDTAPLWRLFSPNLHARARVEIRPALSGRNFLPLAIPDNVVEKAQVRYYDECRDPGHNAPLAVKDLAPLPAADQAAYNSAGGGTLWALPKVDGDLSVGDKNRSFHLIVPDYDPADCGSRSYLPVSVEVRLAARSEIDLNSSCNFLINAKYADCFTWLSQIRAWDDGNPAAKPIIKNVTLTGGCMPTRADAYFGPYEGPLPRGSRTCSYGASVDVDFGPRIPPLFSNFKVKVNGVDLVAPGAIPTGVWTTAGTPIVESTRISGGQELGDNNVTVEVGWTPPTSGPKTYSEVAHRVYIGTTETAGAVDLVRTSLTSFVAGMPGPAFDNASDGPILGCVVRDCEVYPTIGIRTVLKAGILTTLRTEDSQGSQLLQCDPDVSSGQEFTLFQTGCKPYFGKNLWTSPWWNTTTKECPSATAWYKNPAPPPYTNSSGNPWRCVLQAPGSSVGQTGDWMAVATKNCDAVDIANNKCQNIKPAATANCGNYDGKPGDPNGWIQKGGDSKDPRVINLFIVPYQSLKGVTGAKAEIPILGFASFYVMNWKGQNPAGKEDDPCPDPDFNGVVYPLPGKGTVTGVFVETVDYESGPVDPNATCVEEQLGKCRAVLVR